MAKKKPSAAPAVQPAISKPKGVAVPPPEEVSEDIAPIAASWFTFRNQAIVLALIGLLFYANTFKNTWAYDDSLVILQNEYVNQGFAGIGKIFTVDEFDSYVRSQNEVNNQLTGGRYRPLSLVTFAIEQQMLGLNLVDTTKEYQSAKAVQARERKLDRDMHVRHVVNVLLFITSIIVLLTFLRKVVFKSNDIVAFLTALLFLIHPIHTEVVANIKSRDEILSLLFILLTFIYAFRYSTSKKVADVAYANLFFFLALLSKEYAVVLVVLLPLSFYLFKKQTVSKSMASVWVYMAPLFLYFIIRVQSLAGNTTMAEPDIMNNPYLYAEPLQALATKFAVMFDYLRLLVFPHPLIADYTYNQVPYVDFSNYRAIGGVLINGGLAWAMVLLLRKRHVMGFAIALYFAFLGLISNFLVNIGSTMGERLIYHSSLGFAMGIAYLLWLLYKRMPNPKTGAMVLTVIMILIIIPCAIKTIERNNVWTSNVNLFLGDVKTATGSVIINANAGRASMEVSDQQKDQKDKDKWIRTGIRYLDKAIAINPRYVAAYVNRALCRMRLGELDLAVMDCDTITKYYPTHPSLPYISGPLSTFFTNQGLAFAQNGKANEALAAFKKAADAAPTNPDYLYNYAFSLCKQQRFREGKVFAERAIAIKPGHQASTQLLQQLNSLPGL